MYCPCASPTRCQWIGIAGKRQVLTHAIELDAGDIHPARGHRHDVPAEVGLFRVVRSLDADIARQQADFAALIDAEGDLPEMHVVERPIERDRIAVDGGNGAPLGLPGIEVGRGEHDLVADPPAGGVEHFDRVAAGVRRSSPAWSRRSPVAVQAQRAAR